MDNKKNEILQKNLLSCFENIKNKIGKKDKYYSELKDSYTMLKDLQKKNEPAELIIQKFTKFLLMSLETSNFKILEKSILCIETLISYEILDPKIYPDLLKNLIDLMFEKSTLSDDNINY